MKTSKVSLVHQSALEEKKTFLSSPHFCKISAEEKNLTATKQTLLKH